MRPVPGAKSLAKGSQRFGIGMHLTAVTKEGCLCTSTYHRIPVDLDLQPQQPNSFEMKARLINLGALFKPLHETAFVGL